MEVGTKDGRPTEEIQLAEEKPLEDPSNQNPPQGEQAGTLNNVSD